MSLHLLPMRFTVNTTFVPSSSRIPFTRLTALWVKSQSMADALSELSSPFVKGWYSKLCFPFVKGQYSELCSPFVKGWYSELCFPFIKGQYSELCSPFVKGWYSELCSPFVKGLSKRIIRPSMGQIERNWDLTFILLRYKVNRLNPGHREDTFTRFPTPGFVQLNRISDFHRPESSQIVGVFGQADIHYALPCC